MDYKEYKSNMVKEKSQAKINFLDSASQTDEVMQYSENDDVGKSFVCAGSQTKKVILENTALTNIINKIQNDPRESVADRIYDHVRDFKCKVSYEKRSDDYLCTVLVVRGRHVMPVVAKNNFSKPGNTMAEAKEAAFTSLMCCLEDAADAH